MNCPFRVGHGYDVHRFAPDRALRLGGVNVPFDMGLDGNSDADVLLHAVCDAMLGAAALGDIGLHFPDTTSDYTGADSVYLLSLTAKKIAEAGFLVVNVDATVIAQRPKLRPYVDDMRANIASVLGIDRSAVSVKATTEEGLGFTGEMKGIAAHAVCLLEKAS